MRRIILLLTRQSRFFSLSFFSPLDVSTPNRTLTCHHQLYNATLHTPTWIQTSLFLRYCPKLLVIRCFPTTTTPTPQIWCVSLLLSKLYLNKKLPHNRSICRIVKRELWNWHKPLYHHHKILILNLLFRHSNRYKKKKGGKRMLLVLVYRSLNAYYCLKPKKTV